MSWKGMSDFFLSHNCIELLSQNVAAVSKFMSECFLWKTVVTLLWVQVWETDWSEGHKLLETPLIKKCNNPVNECTFIYFDILPSNSISPLTGTSYTWIKMLWWKEKNNFLKWQ